MGVQIKEFEEVQPMCNSCGVALCWSIDESEYLEWSGFWDKWECRSCNTNYVGAYELYKSAHEPYEEVKRLLNIKFN